MLRREGMSCDYVTGRHKNIITHFNFIFFIMSSQKAQIKSQRTIRRENSTSFELNLNKQLIIFQLSFLSQTLNLLQSNINISRTVIIKCLYPHCL